MIVTKFLNYTSSIIFKMISFILRTICSLIVNVYKLFQPMAKKPKQFDSNGIIDGKRKVPVMEFNIRLNGVDDDIIDKFREFLKEPNFTNTISNIKCYGAKIAELHKDVFKLVSSRRPTQSTVSRRTPRSHSERGDQLQILCIPRPLYVKMLDISTLLLESDEKLLKLESDLTDKSRHNLAEHDDIVKTIVALQDKLRSNMQLICDNSNSIYFE